MGLDQTLCWIGKPSKDMIKRLHHKNLSELNYPIGMNYVDMSNEYCQKIYKEIEKYMIPEEVYQNNIDWDLICDDCGMPHGSHMCSIGYNGITFGRAANVDEENHKHFDINIYDERYKKAVKSVLHFFLEDELYRWRNNYDIQDIFNKAHPDEWCEYKQKYEMYDSGIYKLKKSELNKIMKLDSTFAAEWNDGVDHIFYSANW